MRALAVTALALALATAPAHAAGSVGVIVTGDATIQPQLSAQIETWLRQRGHILEPTPFPPGGVEALIDCFVIEDVSCARKVVEAQAKSPNLVFAKVDLADSSTGMRDVTITAYWFERDMEAIAMRRTCEACTDDKLASVAGELMTSLAGKGRAEIGQVTLTSAPSGARVLIDGKEVGVTPLTYALPPGPHAITLEHDLAEPTSRSVEIKTGETAQVDVKLAMPTGKRRTVPMLVLGGGGVLLVGGIIAFAIDEDDTGEKPEYRDTKPLGIVLGVGGLAAVGVGTYLLLRDKSTDGGPRVSFVDGGAVVGWGRAF